MNVADLADFAPGGGLERRLLQGGLPPFFLADSSSPADFQEWLDSYWAKDIQDLFRLERRVSFGRFLELLFLQSGGIFEATRFASPCEISRQTVANYLAVLEATMAAHVVRPFSARQATEITHAPKVYAFDTGFVRHFNGWEKPREEELGRLWEHYVLNELETLAQSAPRYWRDKQGHEIDFVVPARSGGALALECKWKAANFDSRNLAVFRRLHPAGRNLAVCADVERPYTRAFRGLRVEFAGLAAIGERLA